MHLTPLKDIAEFIRTGKTPPTKDTKYFNGEIQWFTPGDLDKGKFLLKSARTLTDEAFKDKKAAQFPPNTLLVACIGDIGKLGITTKQCSSNQQITGIKPKENIDVSYLYYWFTHNKRLIQNTANNAVVPILNNKTLEQIKVPLPPLAEQQKIAAILDAADSLRQKDQQLVERYTALSQSLFLEMFGDPVTNPMGWECLHLGDMLSYLTSGSRGWAKYYSQNGDVFLRIQNIGKNRLILNDITYVNPPVNAEARRTKVEPGDILLSITADLGRTAVIPENFPTAYINQHLAILRVKKEFLPFFVSQFISSVGGERQFLKLDKGGVKAGLNFDDIKSLIIINPPMNLQNQFAEHVQLIEAQKQQAQRSLEKSEALFNSLLQRAFTGELTARVAA